MTSQFLQRPIKHNYEDIRRAVVNQLHMYSPQRTQDKPTAAGYPYPSENGELPKELENFIHRQRQSGKRLLIFTIGSMDIDAEDKARLVSHFVEGVRRMQNTAGIILGHDSAQDEDFITMNQFVPYTTLFPMVDVIVTHGGAGTTHLALYTGKPVLSVPILKDQFDWAERLERLGMLIGVVPKEQFSTEKFLSTLTAGYNADVIRAAQQAAKIELAYNQNNRIASIVDELRLASEALGQQVSGQPVLADLSS
jgi:UDP:flavonoid glycosyltransferase YjiC (YdhE family)